MGHLFSDIFYIKYYEVGYKKKTFKIGAFDQVWSFHYINNSVVIQSKTELKIKRYLFINPLMVLSVFRV